MMTDDLVKRLRDVDHLCVEDCFLQSPLYAYAADRIEALEREAILDAKLLADTQALLDTAVEFIQEVRRNGDTRLASMAIAVLAEIEKGKTNG